MLPQNTPAKNSYVKGMHRQTHSCLGKIYISPDTIQTKAKRKTSRRAISENFNEDDELQNIVTQARKMDTISKFNSPNGPPDLDSGALKTAHQLIGYAVRRVAGEMRVYLRSLIPPKTPKKQMQWKILRTMTVWGRPDGNVSWHHGLTSAREKRPGRLVKFDDQV